MPQPPRLVRVFLAVGGGLAFVPLAFVVVFFLVRSEIPSRGLQVGGAAALMGLAFLWFWFWARTPTARGAALLLVIGCALAASVDPGGLRGAYLIWLYPAAVIGYALRPLRATLTVAGLGVLIVLVAVAGTLAQGPTPHVILGTAVPALITLGLAGWASITVTQLLWNNADLHAAREELARLAVEEERARFARDLHDLLGHTLSLIVVKLELAARLVPATAGPVAAG